MPDSPNPAFTPTHYAGRALAFARSIANLATVEAGADGSAEAHPGRGSATTAEARAAEAVRQQLRRLGVQKVEVQPFQGLRSIWLFLSLAFGVALAGHAAFWLLAQPTGLWPALFISVALFAMSAFLLWRKFTFRSYPLRESLPHGASQNVVAVLPPEDEPRRKVVLVAHLDSHRAVLWYASDILVRIYAAAVPLAIYGVFFAPLLYFLADLTAWRGFALIALVFVFAHFAAWMTGMTADLGPYSPGANDNAAAAGTLLALAERLCREPLQHTEVWLAFTGCEETGCDGLLKLLETQGEMLKDALWLDFELVGIGERLVYLSGEGVLRKRRIPKALAERLESIAQGTGIPIQPVSAAWAGVFTETGALWEHGFQAACLVSLRQGSDLLPEWHRLTDAPDRLEAPALARVHQFAWALLQETDREPT
jgi:hypothetical protein